MRLKKSCSCQTDSYNQLIEAALLEENDLLDTISLSGTSSDLIATLNVAREKQAKSLCITGNPASPLASSSN